VFIYFIEKYQLVVGR